MSPVECEIQILSNLEELTRRAAEEFVRQMEGAIRAKGFFTVALSGGSTPGNLYRLLASEADSFRARVLWEKTHFFWGDERHVPPDHPESNYLMAREAMLSNAPVPSEHIHRIRAENTDARGVAKDYERVISEFFQLQPGQLPRFDLILLGMGADGHTASLFPGTEVLHDHKHLVAAPWVEKFNTYRVTFTPQALNSAACIIFLVSGGEKAETLRTVLQGDYQPELFPAQLVHPIGGRLLWLVDQAAARLLKSTG